MAFTFHTFNSNKILYENTFPDDQEITALKAIMNGKMANKKHLKSGIKRIDARNLRDIIVWGLRTGIIRDNPITGITPDMFNKEGIYEEYPIWYYILNQTASGNIPDLPKSQIEHYKKWINKKFGLDGSNAQFIRFAIAATSPIEPPKTIDTPWKPWTGSRTSLIKIPQTRTSSMINPEGTITKDSTIIVALRLLGIGKNEIPSTQKKSERGWLWNKSPETLWHTLELAKKRRNEEIRHLSPYANKYPETPAQKQQIEMATKQLAVVNSAWDRIRMLFARHGYALPGDEELLQTYRKKLYIPNRNK